jgi:hypothetical protein
MKHKRKWKKDEDVLSVGDQVFLKPDLDSNKTTKSRPLYDHLYCKSFKIISQHNDLYSLESSDKKVIKNIHSSRIYLFRKMCKLFVLIFN